MDVIINSYFKNFLKEFDLEDTCISESKKFEYFTSYLILTNELVNSELELSDLEAINVGDNKGVDSICLIVNGKMVTSAEELSDFIEFNGYIQASILFIQSKTSASFDDAQMGNMGDTIKDFLKDFPTYDYTNEAKIAHDTLQVLYENFAKVKSFSGKAYYVSTGTWNESTSINHTRKLKEKEIITDGMFKNSSPSFEVKAIGKQELNKLHAKHLAPSEVEFYMQNYVNLENTPEGVDASVIGLLPFKEFKKIIVDEDTGGIRNLFYDNVRDDLGVENDVNGKILETIQGNKIKLFPLLNNGITIVAEENKGSAHKFILSDFQVVNGCQTSNVIFECIHTTGIDNLTIPVKIIITKDENIRDEVIVATNQQTEIKKEQLFALTNFQKGLESFFKIKGKIFYERRVNQYKNTSIKKKEIVTLRELIKSFVAVFMEEPHIVSGYFGKIYNSKKDILFKDDHCYHSYYFAAYLQYKFKDLLSRKIIDRKYNKVRYHIFMLFRKIHESSSFNTNMLNQKRIIKYSEDLLELLEDDMIQDSFNKVIQLIDSSGIDIDNQKTVYRKSTTNTLLDKFNELYK